MSANTNSSTAVEKAEEYYNSNDADEFYFKIWGGEHIHVGIYNYQNEPIKIASQRIVPRMAEQLNLDVFKKVLDLGSGYGGGARYLAKNFGCHVTCLNLSERQNERNQQFNMERGLDHLVDVVYGSFEEIPLEDNSFDVVWSQDAMVHSANRDQVVAEAHRVLKPGGHFIFTDLMQDDNIPNGVLGPVLERIHLDSLGSFEFYWNEARKNGFELVSIDNMSQHLVTHYDRVRQETEKQYDEIVDACGKEYIDRMIQGLNQWVKAGHNGHLSWGILHFKKS
ncbi:MAG: methyltransferase domain-containing protein [Nitrospinota bacterium]|nr:methyltransferase domain-containing protein [Nitrospinota bacterium]